MRNEVFQNGRVIRAEVIDFSANTYSLEIEGELVEGPRPLTLDERRMYGPRPLDAIGSAMTLLALLGVVPVEDAANAVGLSPEDLVAEAQAWAVAGS